MDIDIMKISTKQRKVWHYTVRMDDDCASFIEGKTLYLCAGYPAFSSKIGNKKITVYLHRLITGARDFEQVDHINRDKLDCRKENLRICSNQQQSLNKRTPDVYKSSTYRGVHIHQKKWRVDVSKNNKTIHLGMFNTEIEAARAYDKYQLEHRDKNFVVLNFPTPESLMEACIREAEKTTKEYRNNLAPQEVFGEDIPKNGGSYSAPKPEATAQVLQDYTKYLPGLLNVTAAQQPMLANQQLAATQGTAQGYNQLNLDQTRQFGVPLAQAGQDVQRSNALAGGDINRQQIQGSGGQAALAADALARQTNPNYYGVQDAASKQAGNLVNSFNLNGLSPGEANAVERSTNQSNQASGNLGNFNPTTTVSNAMQFGDAFRQKQAALGQALGAANQTATSAQNTGFNPVNIALGQPNASTMGNFGTGTYSASNPSTQNASASNAYGFGSSLLGNTTSMNNSATSGAYGLAQANSIPSYLNALPNVACCFIMLEAYNGNMPWWVRKSRDHYYSKFPSIANGYKKMAKWLVPMMQKSKIVRFCVWRWMVEPLTQYGGWNHRVDTYQDGKQFKCYRKFWFSVWNFLGK